MTETEAKKLLYVLEGAYPRNPFTEASARVYSQMLADIPYAVASEAVRRLMATSKWLPSVSEIRQMCAELMEPVPSAEDAWLEAMEAARAFTPYQTPPELQMQMRGFVREGPKMAPLTARAVAVVGGVEALAYSTSLEHAGREFRRVYESLRQSEMARRQQADLSGGGMQSLPSGPKGESE